MESYQRNGILQISDEKEHSEGIEKMESLCEEWIHIKTILRRLRL